MNNITVLYYLLSGPVYYQLAGDRSKMHVLKNEVLKEIEYFFEKRYIRGEPWHRRYMGILTGVFCVNLLARRIERRMFRSQCMYGEKYSPAAPATMLALKEYNSNRSRFVFDFDPDIFLPDLIQKVNRRVNSYCDQRGCCYSTENMVHANTPLGVELEFSNVGKTAGKFFESHNKDALHNFSKYHYYHLMKFMWRLGAYVDAEMPFKQFIRRGGFLEYTFTRPDVAFKPSEPLTSSPSLAARLIEEAIRFTPVNPHSLHVTFQIDKTAKKLPKPSFDEVLFMLMCTGHMVHRDGRVIESRITERNMKDWAVIRDRRNDDGWVVTVEFTHMRGSRDFVRRKVYEPSILLLLGYKNLFNFSDIEVYSKKLLQWSDRPSVPVFDVNDMLAKVRRGLDAEVSLPEQYKEDAVRRMADLYEYNRILLGTA